MPSHLPTRRQLFVLALLGLFFLAIIGVFGQRNPAGAAPPQPTAAAPRPPLTRAAAPTTGARPNQGQTSGWSQLGGNPQRTHYADAALPPRAGALNQDWRVLWIWNGPSGTDTGAAPGHLSLPDSVSPVAGEGRLYVGHSDGAVRAISAANGAQLWATTIGGAIVNSGAYDSATGAVYFASTNGRLFKLRASNGQLLGEFNAGAEIEQAVLLAGDSAYIGTRGGNLYAVNTATMQQRWAYSAGAPITASAAYASKGGGLIIVPSEDGQVHAVRATNGTRAWRQPVNIFLRPERGERPARYFPDVYAVVAEAADVVIIRSYYNWSLTWADSAGAPSDQAAIRTFIQNNPTQESLFVLDLDDGVKRFVAPVLGGAIGNGDYYYSSPPQVVIKRLPGGSEVAYLLWRNRQSCVIAAASCDGREDTTFGEMDLGTGAIRFVEDHKNEGTIRFPTDEQGALSMVGDVIFHSHWKSLGAVRITSRTTGGSSYASPVPTDEYLSVSNTLGQGQCAQRISAQRFCPVGHTAPGDGYQLDPGFYIYYSSERVYDQFWHPPVRGPIFDSGVLYWRSSDGAIIALAPTGTNPPPTATGGPPPTAGPSPTIGPSPTRRPIPGPFRGYLPLIRR